MSTPEQQILTAEDDARRLQALKIGLSGLLLSMGAFFLSSAFVHSQVSRDDRIPQEVRDFHAYAEGRDLTTAAVAGGVGLVLLANVTIPVFRSREQEAATPPVQTP